MSGKEIDEVRRAVEASALADDEKGAANRRTLGPDSDVAELFGATKRSATHHRNAELKRLWRIKGS